MNYRSSEIFYDVEISEIIKKMKKNKYVIKKFLIVYYSESTDKCNSFLFEQKYEIKRIKDISIDKYKRSTLFSIEKMHMEKDYKQFKCGYTFLMILMEMFEYFHTFLIKFKYLNKNYTMQQYNNVNIEGEIEDYFFYKGPLLEFMKFLSDAYSLIKNIERDKQNIEKKYSYVYEIIFRMLEIQKKTYIKKTEQTESGNVINLEMLKMEISLDENRKNHKYVDNVFLTYELNEIDFINEMKNKKNHHLEYNVTHFILSTVEKMNKSFEKIKKNLDEETTLLIKNDVELTNMFYHHMPHNIYFFNLDIKMKYIQKLLKNKTIDLSKYRFFDKNENFIPIIKTRNGPIETIISNKKMAFLKDENEYTNMYNTIREIFYKDHAYDLIKHDSINEYIIKSDKSLYLSIKLKQTKENFEEMINKIESENEKLKENTEILINQNEDIKEDIVELEKNKLSLENQKKKDRKDRKDNKKKYNNFLDNEDMKYKKKIKKIKDWFEVIKSNTDEINKLELGSFKYTSDYLDLLKKSIDYKNEIEKIEYQIIHNESLIKKDDIEFNQMLNERKEIIDSMIEKINNDIEKYNYQIQKADIYTNKGTLAYIEIKERLLKKKHDIFDHIEKNNEIYIYLKFTERLSQKMEELSSIKRKINLTKKKRGNKKKMSDLRRQQKNLINDATKLQKIAKNNEPSNFQDKFKNAQDELNEANGIFRSYIDDLIEKSEDDEIAYIIDIIRETKEKKKEKEKWEKKYNESLKKASQHEGKNEENENKKEITKKEENEEIIKKKIKSAMNDIEKNFDSFYKKNDVYLIKMKYLTEQEIEYTYKKYEKMYDVEKMRKKILVISSKIEEEEEKGEIIEKKINKLKSLKKNKELYKKDKKKRLNELLKQDKESEMYKSNMKIVELRQEKIFIMNKITFLSYEQLILKEIEYIVSDNLEKLEAQIQKYKRKTVIKNKIYGDIEEKTNLFKNNKKIISKNTNKIKQNENVVNNNKKRYKKYKKNIKNKKIEQEKIHQHNTFMTYSFYEKILLHLDNNPSKDPIFFYHPSNYRRYNLGFDRKTVFRSKEFVPL